MCQKYAKNRRRHSLRFTLFVAASEAPLSTVSAEGARRVERPEALRIGFVGLAAPQTCTLALHGGAHPVEAVAFVAVARHGVLDVEVLGTLARKPGAQLGQVTLVGGFAAGGTRRFQSATGKKEQ